MSGYDEALGGAIGMLVRFEPELAEIVWLSLQVSCSAVVIAVTLGCPLGAWLALARFPGRRAVLVVVNALMGLPAVVVGLLAYLALSRAGPLGALGWLFTAKAMVVAQAILVLPIVTALTRQVVHDLWSEYEEQLRSFGATGIRALPTLLWEGRFSLFTTVLAGFGRAIAEVGAVLIVGGNIAHATRTMTTAIALETSKGDIALALALGIILLIVATAVNGIVHVSQEIAQRHAG
jgi:tungstate transport system permease protein